MKGFKAHTAVVDGLPPKNLAYLGDKALATWATLYHRVEEEGSFPPDQSSFFVTVIPKHTGKGRRPVALFRALHRVWGKVRSSTLRT